MKIELIAERECGHRLARLARFLSRLEDFYVERIFSIEDHKGELTVKVNIAFKSDEDDTDMCNAFYSVWSSLGECEVNVLYLWPDDDGDWIVARNCNRCGEEFFIEKRTDEICKDCYCEFNFALDKDD